MNHSAALFPALSLRTASFSDSRTTAARRPDTAQGAVLNWQLPAGCAQTWIAPAAGELFVVQGRAWLTAGELPLQPEADLVLGAGQSVLLAAGQAVVVEAWPVAGEALQLAWQASHEPVRRPAEPRLE